MVSLLQRWKRRKAADAPDDGRRAAMAPFFDAEFYLSRNPDVAEAGLDPLDHYIADGWREGRDPAPGFSTAFYLAQNPRLAEAGINPLLHYATEGQAAGLPTAPAAEPVAETPASGLTPDQMDRIRAFFDAEFYLSRNPDVAEAGLDPLTHYLSAGWREGRDPAPVFSTGAYLRDYPAIAEAGMNPLVHYVLHGRAERRTIQPAIEFDTVEEFCDKVLSLSPKDIQTVRDGFDRGFYLKRNPDVVQTRADPLLHYLSRGWREGRDPAPDFSTNYYLDANPLIRQGGIIPFVHFCLHGRAEGRAGALELPRSYKVDESQVDWASCPADEIEAMAPNFDADYYLREHPDVAERGIDPVVHYRMVGWRKGYDPRPDFSTRYYFDRYPDIRRSGMNPFLHYCLHGHGEQRETQSYIDVARRDFRPLVSVIVPNYNHGPFLRERIISIAKQGYDNIELIILDDKSTDDSRQVIRATLAELGIKAQLKFNRKNSGNVFAQWRKGLSLASGDLVWICESDDFCEPDFLENLVPAFADQSVNIAFGRIQFADEDGRYMPGLDAYREGAEAGIWDAPLTRPACAWFNGGFGVNNVIANVGGCVFRRMDLPDAVWEEARTYRICGDWFLYVHIAGAGQIAYVPAAVALFRQHGSNTSARNFHRRYYYDETARILTTLIRTWGISAKTRRKFLGKIEMQFKHLNLAAEMGDFDELMGTDALMAETRHGRHVQLMFLGFHTGGGELFPINLANALLQAGVTVSMFAIDMNTVNTDMQKRLNRRIPVYHGSHMAAMGRVEFFDAAGVSVINSHISSCDSFLATISRDPIERPYIVTLHGSYVALIDANPKMVAWILENVTSWIYTADRNLEFFENRPVDWDNFVKLPNAMPRDPRPAPFSRADLGIAEDDVVFTFVARGVKRKGWRAATEAYRRLREVHGLANVHMLMIGDGESTETAQALAEDLPGLHFLGYQSAINGILRLSDCMILPTRFEGESYPLCLIQALQEGVPVIGTDIGEIRSMMTTEDGRVAGLLLNNQRDSATFFAALTQAMKQMCNAEERQAFRKIAKISGQKFDMEKLIVSYEEVFDQSCQQFGITGPDAGH